MPYDRDKTNEIISELVQEVATFFCSDKLLVPIGDYDTKSFEMAGKWNSVIKSHLPNSVDIRVCTKADYLDDIHIQNQDSYGNALNDWFDKIALWASTLRDWDIVGSFELIESHFAKIESTVDHSLQVNGLVDQLIDVGDNRYTRDDILGNVADGVVSAAEHIIDARFVFLGKRLGITEAIFACYQDGLFPFGYNRTDMELLCLRPEG